MGTREEIGRLVAIVDRLEGLLERSALAELELEVEGMTVVLRKPEAIALPAVGAMEETMVPVVLPPEPILEGGSHAVVAPLTGVFYRSPSPGAEPYVREGGQVNAGQVIGLIEAMKLFNEIKSDVSGTVRRITAGDGDLVKAKSTLIEVDPS